MNKVRKLEQLLLMVLFVLFSAALPVSAKALPKAENVSVWAQTESAAEDATNSQSGSQTSRRGSYSIMGPAAVLSGFSGSDAEIQDDSDEGADEVSDTLPETDSPETILDGGVDLFLTLRIDYQSKEDAYDAMFGFRLDLVESDEDGNSIITPAAGLEWELTDSSPQDTPAESGKLTEGGTFRCHAARGIITIHGLQPAGLYRITETECGEYYQKFGTGSVDVMVPMYGDSVSAVMVNTWLKRPLKVSKVLVYDESDPAESKQAKEAVFEMRVSCDKDGNEVEVPLSLWDFTLMEDGQPVEPGSENDPYGASHAESFRTTSEGRFLIKDGQTAVFKDAGFVDSTFTVRETPNDDFYQLSPAEGKAYAGAIEDDEGLAEIVSVLKGGLVLNGEWNALNSGGKSFIDAGNRGNPDIGIEVSLTVTDVSGQTEEWPKADTDISLINEANNKVTKDMWRAGETYRVQPETQVIIHPSSLAGYVSYEASESADSQHRIETWKERHIVTSQEEPKKDKSVTGSIGNDTVVIFTNTAGEIAEKSHIAIQFLDPGTFIRQGAVLTLITERYDGGTWKAAGGVTYVPVYGDTYASDRVNVTKADGKITIEADGTASVSWLLFPEDLIFAFDSSSPSEGMLRIRPLLSETDPEWGFPVGAGSLVNNGTYTLDYSELDRSGDTVQESIVFSTASSPVRISKSVDPPTKQDFRFLLKQVTQTDGSVCTEDAGITPENYTNAIVKSESRKDVSYSVYDSETGDLKREEKTDLYGGFTLKGGQYAEFSLPERSLWTVEEDVPPEYTLQSLKEKTDTAKMEKLADNLLLIGADFGYRLVKEYTVIFDCNGGTIKPDTDWKEYQVSDSRLERTVNDGDKLNFPKTRPTHPDDYIFKGWILNGDESTLYRPNQIVEMTSELAGDSKTLTFTAYWKKPVLRYAVSIYGIRQDTTQSGKKAGLTFGPATGEDYRNRFVECESDTCIHKLSWSEIAVLASTNPETFQSCLEHGCTKAVDLTLSDALKNPSLTLEMDGDGASVLYESLIAEYRRWNSIGSNSGGWPGSRIRATLNGADSYTADGGNVDDGNGKIYYETEEDKSCAGADVLKTSDALISAFPEDLRNAIVPKQVVSDTKYDDADSVTYTYTTYDRLWLFSGRELHTGEAKDDIRDNESFQEGMPYKREELIGASAYSYGPLVGYDESGQPTWWWMRSVSRFDPYYAYVIMDNGCFGGSYSGGNLEGLSPGFCVGEVE